MANNTKMIRDAFGDVIPQTLNENGTYAALANGDVSGIDFSKYKMLRDSFGSPIPAQYFDVTQMKFVPGSIGGGGSGEPGPAGKSAYEVAVQNGFVGTAAQWLASLKGATGATGPQGPTGPAGSNATVTSASVTSALGYTPVSPSTVTNHVSNVAPHQYGNRFEWRFNPTTNSLDLVVLD